MSTVLIGIDLAKSVFQFHGLDAQGKVTLRKHVNRKDFLPFFERMPPGCHVAMEACGTAHHWGRRLQEMGHRVTLLPAHRVKAYVAPGKKNDANDAAAIAEAASRPHIQPIPVKSIEQQAVLALHSSRDLLVRQRTALVNALRGHLAEFGYVAPKGIEKLPQLLRILETEPLPDPFGSALRPVAEQIARLGKEIDTLTQAIAAHAKANPLCRVLGGIPGIGPITASRLVATVPDMRIFPSARHFAAWLGLCPRQNSSGGKAKLGRISKTGNVALRCLLVLGATSLLKLAGGKTPPPGLAWASDLLKRKNYRLASVAMANKMARVVWAVMTSGKIFDPHRWCYSNTAMARQENA